MSQHKSKQDILNEALGDYKDFGFELREPDDHCTELWFKDKKIATYNQTKVTVAIIQEGCKNYMESIVRYN